MDVLLRILYVIQGDNMKKTIFCFTALFFAASVNSAVISNEDFESGAVGWSNNKTTYSNSPLTTFLGRFGKNEGVGKLYTLSGLQTAVTIEFDFYEIDSWDFENFNFYVNNSLVFSDQFKHNREDFSQSPQMSAESLVFENDDGNQNLAFSHWPEQAFHYSYTFNTSDTELLIGFRGTVTQSINDESWGIDNVLITNDIPEPGALILFSCVLVGLGSLNKKRK